MVIGLHVIVCTGEYVTSIKYIYRDRPIIVQQIQCLEFPILLGNFLQKCVALLVPGPVNHAAD